MQMQNTNRIADIPTKHSLEPHLQTLTVPGDEFGFWLALYDVIGDVIDRTSMCV